MPLPTSLPMSTLSFPLTSVLLLYSPSHIIAIISLFVYFVSLPSLHRHVPSPLRVVFPTTSFIFPFTLTFRLFSPFPTPFHVTSNVTTTHLRSFERSFPRNFHYLIVLPLPHQPIFVYFVTLPTPHRHISNTLRGDHPHFHYLIVLAFPRHVTFRLFHLPRHNDTCSVL
jgi:hypothetical protein